MKIFFQFVYSYIHTYMCTYILSTYMCTEWRYKMVIKTFLTVYQKSLKASGLDSRLPLLLFLWQLMVSSCSADHLSVCSPVDLLLSTLKGIMGSIRFVLGPGKTDLLLCFSLFMSGPLWEILCNEEGTVIRWGGQLKFFFFCINFENCCRSEIMGLMKTVIEIVFLLHIFGFAICAFDTTHNG